MIYLLIENEHATKIGIIQYASIKTPTIRFPVTAPNFPNTEPMDMAIPLKIKSSIFNSASPKPYEMCIPTCVLSETVQQPYNLLGSYPCWIRLQTQMRSLCFASKM